MKQIKSHTKQNFVNILDVWMTAFQIGKKNSKRNWRQRRISSDSSSAVEDDQRELISEPETSWNGSLTL